MEMMILDLNLLVRELINRMGRHMIGDDIELILELGKDLGKVEVIAGRIDQVILNLVESARKAIPKGGRLVISTHNTVVAGEVPANPFGPTPKRFVVLSVSISGFGMISEAQKIIFDPYFATQERKKENGPGRALPTVHDLAGQMGGDSSRPSEQGQRTIFQVYFPQEEGSKKQEAKENRAGSIKK